MKALFIIVCALALFACQPTPSATETNAYGMLEFRGEASLGEIGAQEFEFEGESVLLSEARFFEMKLHSSVDALNQPAMGFTPIDHQREDFGDFTESLKGKKLAVIVDGKIIALPHVSGRLGNGGVLGGGRGGYTEEEVNELIALIKAGAK